MALPRQLKEIRFDQGMITKGDRRAMPEAILDLASDVEFDDLGGLRCRFPFDGARNNIVGGGTLSNVRKLAARGSELLCFTQEALYSFIQAASAWELRGTHLAVTVTEQTRFATADDQFNQDRAELNGVVFESWESASQGYLAAFDKATGATILTPTAIVDSTARAGFRLRLVACQTKVLLFFLCFNGSGQMVEINVLVLDPANVATSAAVTPTVVATQTGGSGQPFFYGGFDVVQIAGADSVVGAASIDTAGTFTYLAFTCTTALSIATSTKSRSAVGPIAVACSPDGLHAQIARPIATRAIQGDLLLISSLADVFTNQSIISSIGSVNAPLNIAIAYRAVQNGGHYRAYFTVGFPEGGGQITTSLSNWVDDAGNVGTPTTQYSLYPASRAFAYNQSTFVWMAFGETSVSGSLSTTPQNVYFLYRDDGFLAAKAVVEQGAGFPATLVLPGVQLTAGSTTFSWAAGYNRRISVGTAVAFSTTEQRAPRDVVFTFDSNAARRCVQLGSTLYFACGEGVLAYDGQQIVECGWHVYPWLLSLSEVGSGGSMPTGTSWTWKNSWRWQNASGEVDRSTAPVQSTVTSTAGSDSFSIGQTLLVPTHKTGVALEVWRTAGNPAAGAPFFLVSSPNPATLTGSNAYIPNVAGAVHPWLPTALVDGEADATATINQVFPETTGVLANVAPPPCSIIASDATRVYLAGIPGLPNTVQYSMQRADGSVLQFNDALTFSVPLDGGPITAIGVLDGALIVWCATATYQFTGVGFDNAGGGTNFQLARVISKDLGCIAQEACAYFDDGFLVKTSKGWYVLDRSLNYVQPYIGIGPAIYDAEPVLATTVLTGRHQVRILTTNRMLMYDTFAKLWAQFSVTDGLDMLLWNGTPAYLASGSAFSAAVGDYTLTSMDIETGWIKFGQEQSRAVVDFVQLLGEFRSSCQVQVQIAKDYEATSPDEESGTGAWNYHTSRTWTPFPGTVGSGLQMRTAPKRKRCEALKVRYTITSAPGGGGGNAQAWPAGVRAELATWTGYTGFGPAARLTGIAMPFAIEPNAYAAIAANQKQ